MCGTWPGTSTTFDPSLARRQRALELAVSIVTAHGEGDVLALAREYDDFLAGKGAEA